MPLASLKERKQNEKNNLIDFRIHGKKITLQSRPSPPCSRSSSRIDTALRPMSATPTLFHQQEKHRKTPPWTRPQSADHLSRGPHRRKLAAKFERGNDRKSSKTRKPGGSMINLLESSSFEDNLDTETSITPSPVPSLTEVLRSSGKLEPGLAAKPPIPPLGATSKKNHKSMEDIINIKFQRWFPESVVQKSAYSHCNGTTTESNLHEVNVENDLSNDEVVEPSMCSASHSNENLLKELPPKNRKSQQSSDYDHLHFEAYESPRLDGTLKKLSKSRTMETIVEGDDLPPTPEKSNQKVSFFPSSSKDMLTSKIGKTLNKYYMHNGEMENKTSEKFNPNSNELCEREMLAMIENSKSPCKVMSHLMSEPQKIGPEHSLGISKILEDENASCVISYLGDLNDDAEEKNKNKNGASNQEDRKQDLQLNLNGQRKNGERRLSNEEIYSWMGKNNQQQSDQALGSTYDDILNMLKVLEKEEVESLKLESLSQGRSGNNSACSIAQPVGAKDIIMFLDDLERSDSRTEFQPPTTLQEHNISSSNEPIRVAPPGNGRMAQLMSLDSAELARRVMALTLELEERESVLQSTSEKLKEQEEKLAKNKSDADAVVKRHQKFIDQLLTEKRLLGDQCASVVKEMETKNKKIMQNMEERHGIEMKKLQEKMLAAEKVRREKWLEEKTKKIKEQTVKGLEPELERMTRAHQEELSEIRRAHEKELVEMEASCSRRINAAREQSLRDREQAVTEEREAARKKLEHEMSEVERSYQDQRRRLMAEVRDEKERLSREAEANLLAKSKQLEEKWQYAQEELNCKLLALQEKHEAELKNMRDTLEGERQSWLNHQAISLADKEKQIRELCKKERDRHIDTVIRKLDEEAREKEKLLESKLTKTKEQYEADLKDAEAMQMELRKKLKESRSENQQNEETFNRLKTQISSLECQLISTKQQLERAERESNERGAVARSEVSSQLTSLQKELTDERLRREEFIANLQAEKERELQQVYNRVKDAISKKEETIRLVQKQRDAALEQCSQLENMLEQQRKDFVLRKHH